MSHHIHHTKAFILDSRPSAEANRTFTFFTEELGLVVAQAQGVRLLKSKLRFVLQDYSPCEVDLVRGKEVWRITSAQYKIPGLTMALHKEYFHILERIAKLIIRLCPGESPNHELFTIISDFYEHALSKADASKEYIEGVEIIVVLKILHCLGYIGESSIVTRFAETPFRDVAIHSILEERKSILIAINNALTHSQL